MIDGVFRDDHPRVSLELPGLDGPFVVEFIVDTGFAGELALPRGLARRLDSVPGGRRRRRQADGSRISCPAELVDLEWNTGGRPVEVLVLEECDPLLGTQLLRDMHLHVEMFEGGQVLIEPI